MHTESDDFADAQHEGTAAPTAGSRQAIEDDCAPIIRKATWRLLPFLFFLYILAYLDRINVSFAGLQMNQDLGFSDEVFGLGAGVFFLGYFLFGVPSNLMVQKFGARRWISAIMLVWGSISVSLSLASSANIFYGLRFFLGVAEAGFFPGIILYLTYWFPKRQTGSAVAGFMSAIPVAGVVGGIVSSQILMMNGVLGIAGWKWLFIITGAPSVLLGLVVWLYLPDGPPTAGWLTNTEKSKLLNLLKLDRQIGNGSNKLISSETAGNTATPSVFLSWRLWQFALMYFCLTLGMYGFQLWLPQIIHGFGGLSDSQTALLTAIPAVFQAFGIIVIAKLSDRSGERRFHLATSATLAAIGLIASSLVKDKVLALGALSLTALGIWGTVGPFWAMPTAMLSPATAAAGIAVINSVGNLGGFVGPYLIGWIKTHTANFSYAMDAMAASLLLAAALSIAVPKPEKSSESAQPER